MKLKIWSSPSCIECQALKNWLAVEGIEYEEFDAYENIDEFNRVVGKTKQLKVPTIDIDDEYVVGFNKKKLDELIKKNASTST